MPEYLTPGVYVEEVEMGARPIEGVSTTTTFFEGYAQRGPLNHPTLVTSFAEFQRIFGGFIPAGDEMQNKIRWLAYAVQGFFDNGGKRAYINRVAFLEKDKDNSAAPANGFVPKVVDPHNKNTYTLAKEASPGEMGLSLNKTPQFSTGDTLLLKDDAQSEFLQYEDFAKEITLDNKLSNNYTAGTVVNFGAKPNQSTATLSAKANAGSSTITLSDVSAIEEGDILLIEDKSQEVKSAALMKKEGEKVKDSPGDSNVEVVKVKSRDNEVITIEGKLLNGYNSGANVFKLDGLNNASLLLDAKAGQTTIYLPKDSSIKKNDLLVFEGYGAVFTVQSVVDSNKVISVEPKLEYAHQKDKEVIKLVKAFEVNAANEGTWGNSIKVSVKPSDSSTKTTRDAKNTNILYLESVNGIAPGTILRIPTGSPSHVIVKGVHRTSGGGSVVIEGSDTVTVSKDTTVKIQVFNLVVTYKNEQEFFNDLSLSDKNSRFIKTIVNQGSNLIRIGKIDQPMKMPMPIPDRLPGWPLSGGNDGIPADENQLSTIFIGKDKEEPDQRTGLYTLQNVDELSMAAVPGITDKTVQDKLLTLCGETMKSCFAVLDPEEKAGLEKIKTQRNLFDTSYGALYYPRVYAFDPDSGGYLNVPPSGMICGIYARTDVERGVHKAPANAKINGAFGLEKLNGKFRVIDDGAQGILNPMGIDCIRDFPGQGIVVWGARTMSSNTLWKYINVRRLFIFVEQSLLKGLRWVVFEPNDENLWARVKQTISQFLTTVWRQGALMGTTPQEAFFVICDRTTMTQDDIDNGRLICKVGLAPVKPAEFVIIRIAQWQGGAAVSE